MRALKRFGRRHGWPLEATWQRAAISRGRSVMVRPSLLNPAIRGTLVVTVDFGGAGSFGIRSGRDGFAGEGEVGDAGAVSGSWLKSGAVCQASVATEGCWTGAVN